MVVEEQVWWEREELCICCGVVPGEGEGSGCPLFLFKQEVNHPLSKQSPHSVILAWNHLRRVVVVVAMVEGEKMRMGAKEFFCGS